MRFKKLASIVMAVAMIFCLSVGAFAAGPSSVADATIDMDATGTINIYKFDMTQMEKDGVSLSDFTDDGNDYVSDGKKNDALIEYLTGTEILSGDTTSATADGGTTAVSQSNGNGTSENSYAIKGVVFSYVKVADLYTYSMTEYNDETGGYENVTYLLYAIESGDELLGILGLDADDAYYVDGSKLCFTSDTLNAAIESILENDRTNNITKIENYLTNKSGSGQFAETDENGYTSVSGLELGLYLIAETSVPEDVSSTVAPFFASLPMTSVDGSVSDDGGNEWLYEIWLYPKNETAVPSLEKTVRESAADTGDNSGTDSITDGYSHTGTGSAGDVFEFQIISTIPTITSESTALSTWTFVDYLQYGLTYNQDIKVEIFSDADCTDLVATFVNGSDYSGTYAAAGTYYITVEDVIQQASGSDTSTEQTRITVTMTEDGLAAINGTDGSNGSGTRQSDSIEKGYSGYTMRITYSATLNSDAETVVYGDASNVNEVYLKWSRSNTSYYDILIDDVHIYTYGLNITKTFSDNNGDFSNVEFVLQNATDGYYVVAVKDGDGVYYVVDDDTADHSAAEADATHFIPDSEGNISIYGLENDTYILTEVRTDNGYTLLQDDIEIVITTVESDEWCSIYTTDGNTVLGGDTIIELADKLGLTQNDIRWVDSNYSSMKTLQHRLLTASATVDGNDVTMRSYNDSANAIVPLSVNNTRGFKLPGTGGNGNWLMPTIGVSLALLAVVALVIVLKKREDEDESAA